MWRLAPLLVFVGASLARAETFAGVAAGGGWDSNLTRSSEVGAAVKGGFAVGRAWLGRAVEFGEANEASLELAWEGTHLPAVSILSEHRPALAAAWLHELADGLRLRLGAVGALRLAVDRARSGSELGGSLALRWRATPRLAFQVGTAFLHRRAGEAAYGGDSWRARVTAEWGLWRRADLAFGYAADVGQDAFPAPAAVEPAGAADPPPPGGAGESPGSPGAASLGGGLAARRAFRVGQSLSVDLAQGLPGGFFVQAGYGFSWVRSAAGSWNAHTLGADVGWRH